MPLELGVFLGIKNLGARRHKEKSCIIFDRERWRYPRFLSDIAGQDIHSHDGSDQRMIEELAAWLRTQSRDPLVPGGRAIADEFRVFQAELPNFCLARGLQPDELTFGDLSDIIVQYLTV